MINVKRLIIALYKEFDDITVYAAADQLINMGWAHQLVQIENEFWSVKDLFYEYDDTTVLARGLIPVQWTGGPLDDGCTYTGSFLTVLLDLVLRKKWKECQIIHNG